MENKDKERLQKLFDEFLDQDLFQISLGNPLDRETIQKAKVRPFLSGGELRFQLEEWIGKQVFHKNMDREECGAWLTKLLGQSFRQCEIQSEKGWAQVLVGRRGTVTIKKKGNPAGEPARIKPAGSPGGRQLLHNRKKTYVLEEGIPVPFLVDLGVMTREGKIVQARYDKFRQINRFLEFIEDVLPQLPKDREHDDHLISAAENPI